MRKSMTEEQLLQHMIDYYEKNKVAPTTRTLKLFLKEKELACNTFRFGGFNELLAKANIPLNKATKVRTIEEISSFIKEYYKEKKESPSIRKMHQYLSNRGIKATLAHPTYPTWNELLGIAGVPLLKETFTKEEIIDLLKRDYKDKKVPPSFSSWQGRDGFPNPTTVVKYFGSWNQALRVAGIPLNQENDKYSDLELLNMIREFFNKYNRIPFKDELALDRSVFIRRFGSWKDAIIEAGFIPNSQSSFGALYYSNHGDLRPSTLEGLVDDFIHNRTQVPHKHDVPYNTFFVTNRQFDIDFVIKDKWLIECAGMLTEEDFYDNFAKLDKITQDYKEKIKLKMEIVENARKEGNFTGEFIVLFHQQKLKNINNYLSNKLAIMIQDINNNFDGVPVSIPKTGRVVKPSEKLQKYTDEQLIEILHKLAKELDRKPKLSDLRLKGYPTQKTYLKRCKWSIWLKRAGFES